MSEINVIKRNYKDMFLPSVMIILATALVFGGFYAIKAVNSDLICQISDVAGEETNPSVGRLICCLVYFALSITLVVVAGKIWKADQSKMLRTFAPAVLGGTLLWTAVGECSWHFGFNVLSDEGDVIFASFPRIESVQGIPFFVLTILIIVACFRRMSFPLATYILAFVGNWYGHLCMIAFYPVASAMGLKMELGQFYKISALVNAVLIAAAGVYLIAGKTKRTTKYLASIAIYVALGNILFGILMGET